MEYISSRKKLPDSTITVLSVAFGNFDRMVAAGWLLADALGMPLLACGDAHAAGLKARRESGRIKAACADIKLHAHFFSLKNREDSNLSGESRRFNHPGSR